MRHPAQCSSLRGVSSTAHWCWSMRLTIRSEDSDLNIKDLKPAKEFALQFGVKAIVYGRPGTGKTPILGNTSPRPLILMSEPGMLSMKASTVPTYPAFTKEALDEFFAWFFESPEAKAFDTLIWDSVSQAAEFYVEHLQTGKSKGGNKVHGQEAYGQMGTYMMDKINRLYFMKEKHIVLIAKWEAIDLGGVLYARPYFPGKMLPTRVPHLYDLITQLGNFNVPGEIGAKKAFRTVEDFTQMGRDRSGNLAEFERPDMGKIIAKCMK